MKNTTISILKTIVLLATTGAIIFMIIFPQTEGRAVNLDIISIYTDLFIIYIYIASIPFFIAIRQIIRLLGLAGDGNIFSSESAKTVRNIRYCAIASEIFIIIGISYIFVNSKSTDNDGAGAIMFGLVLMLVTSSIMVASIYFQKKIEKNIEIKS